MSCICPECVTRAEQAQAADEQARQDLEEWTLTSVEEPCS